MSLPYSVAPLVFPFRALASLAARLPLGGDRELALASLMAGRLACGLVPSQALSAPARESRAAGARVWFSTLALPGAARPAIARLLDATEQGDPAGAARALAEMVAAAGAALDRQARAELAAVIAALEPAEVP